MIDPQGPHGGRDKAHDDDGNEDDAHDDDGNEDYASVTTEGSGNTIGSSTDPPSSKRARYMM